MTTTMMRPVPAPPVSPFRASTFSIFEYLLLNLVYPFLATVKKRPEYLRSLAQELVKSGRQQVLHEW